LRGQKLEQYKCSFMLVQAEIWHLKLNLTGRGLYKYCRNEIKPCPFPIVESVVVNNFHVEESADEKNLGPFIS